MKTNPTRLKYTQEEPLSTNSVQDTEDFYKLLTDEQIEFLSSYNADVTSPHPHYVDVSGEYMWLSDGDLMIKTGSTYYSHSINSIKTYIRDKKIEKILQYAT